MLSRALLLLTAIAAHAAPPPQAARVLASYDPQIAVYAKTAGRSAAFCPLKSVVLQAKDPVSGEQGKVTVKEYAARSGAPGRTIIVVPPTGGENIVDDAWSDFFCARGFRVLLVQHWDHDDYVSLDPAMHDLGALRAIAAVRHTTEYAERSGAGSIGILGASVGAITSALSLEIDPRLRSGVLVVGGAGMAQIIADSNEKTLSKLRQERMSRYGYATIGDYQAALAKAVLIDPLDFAGFSGRKPALAFVALKDVTVPTANQLLLTGVLDAQKIELDTDHVGAVTSAYWSHRPDVLEFFQRTLD